MPNENDERYEGTFETFSTQGYNATDKFDLDVTKGNLCCQKIHVTGKEISQQDTLEHQWHLKNSKSRQTLSTLSVTSARQRAMVLLNTGYLPNTTVGNNAECVTYPEVER